jgi:carboxyl-terminal processing protease
LNKTKKFMKWLSLTLCITLCSAQDNGSIKSPKDSEDAAYPAMERFIEVLETIRSRHPDVDKVTYDRLVNHALEGMLSSLDPHSSYIHPEMAAAMQENENIDPFIASLGLTVGLRDTGPFVSAVTSLSQAAKAKLIPDTSILCINGIEVTSIKLPELIKSLTKAPGEITTIKVKSPLEPKPFEVKLTHTVVEQKAITHSELLAEYLTIGYVRLAHFSAISASEIETALDDLEDKGMKSLILDLRGNPGGDLPATVKILGLFLPVTTQVVSVHTRDPKLWENLTTPDKQRRERKYPITVLIDRMSASASELTAGCLQDLKRATIIGEVSYGKGSVQNIIPMNNGTALRLTIATYHTPSGRTPHGVGITPDNAIEFTELDRTNFPLSLVKKTLSEEQQKAIATWKDPALTKAIEVLTKK